MKLLIIEPLVYCISTLILHHQCQLPSNNPTFSFISQLASLSMILVKVVIPDDAQGLLLACAHSGESWGAHLGCIKSNLGSLLARQMLYHSSHRDIFKFVSQVFSFVGIWPLPTSPPLVTCHLPPLSSPIQFPSFSIVNSIIQDPW